MKKKKIYQIIMSSEVTNTKKYKLKPPSLEVDKNDNNTNRIM